MIFPLSVIISMTIPKLHLLLSLDGALLCSLYTTLIPTVLDILIIWEKKNPVRIGFDVFILLVGTFSMVVGTYTSSVQIYNFFMSKNE